MTLTNGESDARLAVTAARAGAAVVRDLYGGRLARHEKGAGDFATEADLAAERAILEVLHTARPDDAVTGEESGPRGAAGARRRWLVDPLCGTLNYAVRTRLVGVNVALRVDGETTAAATADPFTGEVFWTDGTRARLSTGDGDSDGEEKLTPSAASALVDVNLDPPFPNAPAFRAPSLLADPDFIEWFRPGWSPAPSPSPGSPPGAAPPTSPTAISPTACTSPPGSPCAGPPGARSPACTASPCTPAGAA